MFDFPNEHLLSRRRKQGKKSETAAAVFFVVVPMVHKKLKKVLWFWKTTNKSCHQGIASKNRCRFGMSMETNGV